MLPHRLCVCNVRTWRCIRALAQQQDSCDEMLRDVLTLLLPPEYLPVAMCRINRIAPDAVPQGEGEAPPSAAPNAEKEEANAEGSQTPTPTPTPAGGIFLVSIVT